ncbi:zinc finger, RING-type [Musa troglodytarum]|uniref:RING-type E3 ubiquitin transferase n=1 Tax=Musa troglodytarum TaxID=320322 RepID=A0A9E7IH69_9LILI|nr:zinc finger, RING-type [Musa troglodytarum]
MASMETASTYWCHHCCRFVLIWPWDAVVCPDCGGGFLDAPGRFPLASETATEPRRRRVPSAVDNSSAAVGLRRQSSEVRFRRNNRASTGDRSPFNPVIVLRSPPVGGRRDADWTTTSSFELYYDDGTQSGLRPLPESMSEFLMGSGLERILDQLSQTEVDGIGGAHGFEYPPASKVAIDSMPTIEIADGHISMESHCAVCKDPFELGTEVREMPCKHIYHQDCILPWLSLRNSCPLCRHEMPTDVQEIEDDERTHVAENEEETVGLTVWRLPGGGFAVGRFTGGRRGTERELPMVYTEMDEGISTTGTPRRISWSSRGNRSRESGRIVRAFRNFFSFFRRLRSPPTSSLRLTSESRSFSTTSLRHRRYPFFSRSYRGHSTSRVLEDGELIFEQLAASGYCFQPLHATCFVFSNDLLKESCVVINTKYDGGQQEQHRARQMEPEKIRVKSLPCLPRAWETRCRTNRQEREDIKHHNTRKTNLCCLHPLSSRCLQWQISGQLISLPNPVKQC